MVSDFAPILLLLVDGSSDAYEGGVFLSFFFLAAFSLCGAFSSKMRHAQRDQSFVECVEKYPIPVAVSLSDHLWSSALDAD